MLTEKIIASPGSLRIAYLEDEPIAAAAVCHWLNEAGYQVSWFKGGNDCARAVERERFDACLLDWMVPDLPGTEVLERIQIKLQENVPPVIFLTSRDSEEDLVKVLAAGADDYIVKPVSRVVLLARLQAVLRRSGTRSVETSTQRFGPLGIDYSRRQFAYDEKLVSMSKRETDLAIYFFQNIDRLLTRERLIQVVWGLVPDVDTRTVDVHVSAIRRKLNLKPESGWELASVYRQGYRLERLTDHYPGR